MSQETANLQELHKKLAVQFFNGTWDIIDKTDRTPEETLKMIHMAHASRLHWGEVGTPLNFLRGEWQISRVYALAKMGESALYHAKQCLNLCQAENIGDFDLAFAHEALARAYMICGDEQQKQVHLREALAVAETIAKPENKDYVLAELKTII